MDVSHARSVLHMNGVEPANVELARATLIAAGYGAEEAAAALMVLRAEGAIPAAMPVASPVATATPLPPKRPGFLSRLLPKRWLSLHGFAYALVAYFVVAPIVGFFLLWGLVYAAFIPGVAFVSLPAAIGVYYVGHFTGINMLSDFYQRTGYSIAANVLSNAPENELVALSCAEGGTIRLSSKRIYAVERSYFDAVPIGYQLSEKLYPVLELEQGGVVKRYPAAGPGASVVHDMPFVPEGQFVLFRDDTFADSRATIGNELRALNGTNGDGAQAPPSLIRVDPADFSEQEFAGFARCLDADALNKLDESSYLLDSVVGMYRGTAVAGVDWGSADARFMCPDGPTVTLQAPRYLSVFYEIIQSEEQIGIVNDDLTTRALTAAEREATNEDTYFSRNFGSYELAVACLDRGESCNPVQSRKELEFQRSYYGSQFIPMGLGYGMPSNFDRCRNGSGQTIKEYLSAAS